MNKFYLSIIAFNLLGCGQSFVPCTETGSCVLGTGGASGGNVGSGGDASTGGQNNTGGTVNNTGGASGGTETGGVSNDTGGSNSTGGNKSTGGDGNTCVPKTCEEITLELTGESTEQGKVNSACGVFDDGCSGEVTCSCGVPSDCGQYIPIEDLLLVQKEQESNLCGGGCIEITRTQSTQNYIDERCTSGGRLIKCPHSYHDLGEEYSYVESLNDSESCYVGEKHDVFMSFCCE